MIFEHEFIDLANTAGISNVSTRGQPITSTLGLDYVLVLKSK